MSTLKNYKRSIKKLFFMSVKNDLEKKWYTSSSKGLFYSLPYNDFYFVLDRTYFVTGGMFYLKLANDSPPTTVETKVSTYEWLFVPIDFKVWWYARKVKRHFKKIKQDKKNANQIKYLKSGVENIQKEFVKEVRKEKLDKIG